MTTEPRTISKSEANSYAAELLLKHYDIDITKYSRTDIENLVRELRFFQATMPLGETNWETILRG